MYFDKYDKTQFYTDKPWCEEAKVLGFAIYSSTHNLYLEVKKIKEIHSENIKIEASWHRDFSKVTIFKSEIDAEGFIKRVGRAVEEYGGLFPAIIGYNGREHFIAMRKAVI